MFHQFINFSFEFSLATPALVFSSVSLLMLAYTNRFVVIADLIRDLHKTHQNQPNESILKQINNLEYRMDIIKKMQMFGAASFITSIISMIALAFGLSSSSFSLFIISLITLVISLLYLLRELSVSIDALKIQLDDIHSESQD